MDDQTELEQLVYQASDFLHHIRPSLHGGSFAAIHTNDEGEPWGIVYAYWGPSDRVIALNAAIEGIEDGWTEQHQENQ